MVHFSLAITLLAFCSHALFGGNRAPKPNLNPPTPVPLHVVVNQIQSVWDATRTYRVKFKQVVFSRTIGSREEMTGTIYVKKPDKLRWEQADGAFEIMNGKTLTLIQPNKRRGTTVVDIFKDFMKKVDVKPLTFLAGKSKLRELYQIQLGEEDKKKIALKLLPKDGSSETYIAEIDKTSYLLLALVSETAETRSRLDLLETITNLAIGDKLFEYQPKTTDVVHLNP